MTATDLPSTLASFTELSTESSSLERELYINTQPVSVRFGILNTLALAMHQASDVDAVLRVLSAQGGRLLSFDHCSVCLWTGESWTIRTLAGLPAAPEFGGGMDTIERALISRRMQLIDDGAAEGVLSAYTSVVVIPLEVEFNDQLVGTVQFASMRPNAYAADDTRIAVFLALQLATALANAERVETLEQQVAGLDERNRELDAYGYTIAHDLKAPLNLIYGYTNLLELVSGDAASDQMLDYIGRINDGVVMMTRMIDQLLLLARLSDQNEVLEAVEVMPVLVQAIERFQTAIEDRRIQIDIMEHLPNVCGHAAWLEEVFANLIGNAIQYMGAHNERPCIRVRARTVGSHVRYEIRDNGIGIAPVDQERLFTRFTRLDNLHTGGDGLGLTIVQRIITRLNGSVGVESAAGTGSTFWFTLPAACN